MSKTASRRIDSIQAIRFLAALFVSLFHFGYISPIITGNTIFDVKFFVNLLKFFQSAGKLLHLIDNLKVFEPKRIVWRIVISYTAIVKFNSYTNLFSTSIKIFFYNFFSFLFLGYHKPTSFIINFSLNNLSCWSNLIAPTKNVWNSCPYIQMPYFTFSHLFPSAFFQPAGKKHGPKATPCFIAFGPLNNF